ncbi:hypothetical protein ACI797_27695 [Geodermatophilus sp. SYSU D00691]
MSVTADPPPTVVGDPAGCPVSELRPTIERAIPIAEGVEIAEVRVTHCRNDYARVVLVAKTSAPDAAVDDLPVYLRKAAGGWSVVDYGGHITCSHEEGLGPETVKACRALEN